MQKKYIYLFSLIIVTVVLTLFLSNLYNKKVLKTCYLYEHLNKITATEFEEYMIEHPDTIIYIGDKTVLENDKFEKKLLNKLKKMNLLKVIVYIEKGEINEDLETLLEEEYLYKYEAENLPVIIVVNDGKVIQVSTVRKDSDVNDVIDYEVFK